MSLPQRHMSFVLSAGRTGSVFLAQAIDKQFADVCCVHEPPPARWELMLGIARNEFGVGAGLLRRMFFRARRRRLRRLTPDQKYVEVNPMLSPVTDLLELLPKPLRVVHVVRDPRTWTRSILSFKASGVRRHVIDYVPFATPYPSPRPEGWKSLSATGRALWRWRYSNDRIRHLAPVCERYALVCYEDLFSSEQSVRDAAIRRILETLEIDSGGNVGWFQTEQRINAAPTGWHDRPGMGSGSHKSEADERSVISICEPLLTEFGYARGTPVTT